METFSGNWMSGMLRLLKKFDGKKDHAKKEHK
jgi:hypothetical protein